MGGGEKKKRKKKKVLCDATQRSASRLRAAVSGSHACNGPRVHAVGDRREGGLERKRDDEYGEWRRETNKSAPAENELNRKIKKV